MFCISFFVLLRNDPKYKFYRGGMFLISLVGVINLLPFFEGNAKGKVQGIDFVFQLGIQDSWYISIGLFILAGFLFYKQPV